jgi:hypothetical protein
MPRLRFTALVALYLVGSAPPTGPGPRYTADGALRRPEAVDRWVAVGTSLGLGYSDRTSGGSQMFHRVYLEPSAYDAVRRTGRFPRGTMLALSLAPAGERVPPARDGVFADRAVQLKVAVKDPGRFPGGWAYFDFGAAPPGAIARPLPRERCERCHAEHGVQDHVFVQFYPLLRDRDGGALPTSSSNGMLSAPE